MAKPFDSRVVNVTTPGVMSFLFIKNGDPNHNNKFCVYVLFTFELYDSNGDHLGTVVSSAAAGAKVPHFILADNLNSAQAPAVFTDFTALLYAKRAQLELYIAQQIYNLSRDVTAGYTETGGVLTKV